MSVSSTTNAYTLVLSNQPTPCAMSESDNDLIISLCLLIAIVYALFELARLMLPVWAWRFDKNARKASDILRRAQGLYCTRQIAESAPADACLARLMRSQDLTEEEEIHRKDFRRTLFWCGVAFAISLVAQYHPCSPEATIPLSAALLIVTVGMVTGAVARFRIYRTMLQTETALDARCSEEKTG